MQLESMQIPALLSKELQRFACLLHARIGADVVRTIRRVLVHFVYVKSAVSIDLRNRSTVLIVLDTCTK